MTIEAQLERIANALETLASSTGSAPAASSSTKPAKSQNSSGKATSETKSSPESSDPVIKEAVREALKMLQKVKGAAAAREMLANHGAKTLTDLDEAKFGAVIKEAKESASD